MIFSSIAKDHGASFTAVVPTERSKQLLLSAARHPDSFNKVPSVITGCHFLSIKFLFGGNGSDTLLTKWPISDSREGRGKCFGHDSSATSQHSAQ